MGALYTIYVPKHAALVHPMCAQVRPLFAPRPDPHCTRLGEPRRPHRCSAWAKVPSWWRHSPPPRPSAWGGLSRLLATLRTRDAPRSRSGPDGRRPCGCAALCRSRQSCILRHTPPRPRRVCSSRCPTSSIPTRESRCSRASRSSSTSTPCTRPTEDPWCKLRLTNQLSAFKISF